MVKNIEGPQLSALRKRVRENGRSVVLHFASSAVLQMWSGI